MHRLPRLTLILLAAAVVAACESAPPPSPGPSDGATIAPEPTPSGAPTPSASPGAIHWQTPDDGSVVREPVLTLRARADGASAGATVTFLVDWPGADPTTACEDVPANGQRWRCDVDLAGLGAPAGEIRARFDVDRGKGQVERTPDGVLTLDYSPAAASWTAARTILPKSCTLPALTVASGRYHAASACGSGIRYAEGTADGTWTESRFRPPADHVESGPQLAIDGDTLYLAYTRYGPVTDADTCGGPYSVWYEDLGVYVRTRTLPDGAWSEPRQLGKPDDILDSLRVSDGRVHAVVLARSGQVPVLETIDGDALVRERLRGMFGPVSLRVGSDGRARIAHLGKGGIRVTTVFGIESTSSVVADRGVLANPLLVLGRGNQPHVVYTRYADTDEGCGGGAPIEPVGTWYATFTDGAWVNERVTRATGRTSLVIDPATGAVHVLVNGATEYGGGKLRYFERAPGGGWTSTTLGDHAESGAVIRRDESDGTLVVAFKDRFRDPVQVVTRP